MANQNTNLTWQAQEFRHYPKKSGWYAVLILVTLAADAFFLYERDVFGAVCLAIIAVIIVLFSRHRPQIVDIEINENGVKFGNVFHPYKELKYFWIVNDKDHRTINFHTSALLNNTLILELEDQDPQTVRKFLLRHLREHSETQATPAQKIMHRFRF